MDAADTTRPRVSLLNNPKARGIAYQVALCALIGILAYGAISNAIKNLPPNIASGFDFWSTTAGFDISQTLIEYSITSTYGRAFWVGLLNTLLVAGIGIVLATFLGFVIGIARLSRNWLLARMASVYVEVIRNIPLLLQLLFWYNAVLQALPEQLQDSFVIFGGGYLNRRGLFLPQPMFGSGAGGTLAALVLGIVAAIIFWLWAKRRQERTGARMSVSAITLGLILAPPFIVLALAGFPVDFRYPQPGRFNIEGGIEVLPEFMALLLGLVIYTAAFIAEVVRAGLLAVSRGQTEAAYSLGLRSRPTLRLVVIPQAMRVIIPPLTSQYLNLTKNSSLAVAIGYPDLVQIFTGTVLNQTGQAVEVVALTMAVYLSISLVTSLLLNLYNRRVALVER